MSRSRDLVAQTLRHHNIITMSDVFQGSIAKQGSSSYDNQNTKNWSIDNYSFEGSRQDYYDNGRPTPRANILTGLMYTVWTMCHRNPLMAKNFQKSFASDMTTDLSYCMRHATTAMHCLQQKDICCCLILLCSLLDWLYTKRSTTIDKLVTHNKIQFWVRPEEIDQCTDVELDFVFC